MERRVGFGVRGQGKDYGDGILVELEHTDPVGLAHQILSGDANCEAGASLGLLVTFIVGRKCSGTCWYDTMRYQAIRICSCSQTASLILMHATRNRILGRLGFLLTG